MNSLDRDIDNAPLTVVARNLAKGFWERGAEHDRAGAFPFDNFKELYEAGILAANVPARVGGGGLGPHAGKPLELWALTRQIASGDPASGQCYHVHTNEVDIILSLGNSEQHDEFLRPVAERGSIIGGYGSQVVDGKPVTAKRTDRGWVLNGSKFFCTNSEAAEFALVFAVVDGDGDLASRIQVFFVPHSTPGMSIKRGWWENFQGLRSTASHVVDLVDVEVDENAALGGPGDYMTKSLQPRNFCQFAASFIGIADRFHQLALNSVAYRHLENNAACMARLGRARVNIDAAWGLVQRAAISYTHNDADAPVKATIARYFAEKTLRQTMEESMDTIGTFSGNTASGVFKIMRDANLYFRHESIDRLLNIIGCVENGSDAEINFGGDNPLVKGMSEK